MIAKGKSSVSLDDILDRVTESNILAFYIGITKIPDIIRSPLRKDNNPSFGLYTLNGKKIYYKDFATGEEGGTFDLLGKLWNCSYNEVLERISKDLSKFNKNIVITKQNNNAIYNYKSKDTNDIDLQCKIREWKNYDIQYWESFGISLQWLKYAEVYPISHKIIIKNGKQYIFGADKYAYVYVEHKDNKVTLKIYQPFNKIGYKWSNKHDSSVISLWTKLPKQGEKVCICSSLKDALCLWSNLKIPSIAIQGEGYKLSNTVIQELKQRFNKVYICLDNDEPGLLNAKKLEKDTNFINVVLPPFKEGKDISDFYKSVGKETFVEQLNLLFK